MAFLILRDTPVEDRPATYAETMRAHELMRLLERYQARAELAALRTRLEESCERDELRRELDEGRRMLAQSARRNGLLDGELATARARIAELERTPNRRRKG